MTTTKDKGEGEGNGRERGEPSTIDRLKELTRKVLAVPKSEVDQLAERGKRSGNER